MSTRPPDEIRDRPQWVTWKNVSGRKVPFDAQTGKPASSTDPATWSTYEQAQAAYQRRHHSGIGYVFSPDDPYTGIDLDDCIDDAGELAPWARTIVDTMQTYTEVSPSGTGVKLWVRGCVPSSVKTKQIEIYSQGRYFTFTGRQLPGIQDTIRSVNGELTALYESLKPTPQPAPNGNSEESSHYASTTIAPDADHVRRYCLAALEGERQKMLDAGDGERHNRRYDSAHALGGLIHTGGLTEDEIVDALAVNFGRDRRGAMKTIDDGIKAGREHPRDIPPPQERSGLHFSSEVTPETIVDNPEAEHWRQVAQFHKERADMLEGYRAWTMDILAIKTERLSPSAKVTALTLWPEMQSRAEQGIDEPKEIYIEEAHTKTGLTAGTYGDKLQELAAIGALERQEGRRTNGRRKTLIRPTTLWATPADWQPEAPRNHGGADRHQGRRPVPPCPTHGDDAAVIVEEQKATRYLCAECETPLGHTFGKIHRHTWRANNQVDCSQDAPVPNEEANNQVAPIEDDCSSPPINQVDCWVPPESPAFIPAIALMDPSDTPGVQHKTIAPDDLWFSYYQTMAAQRAVSP